MNKTVINFLQQNWTKKFGGKGRGQKIPSGTVVNEEITQEEQQLGLCANATIFPNHQIMRAAIKKKMMVVPAKYARSHGQNICDEYICPKCYRKRDIFADYDFFVVFASDRKY